MNVLFADDNPETRELFSLCFSLQGHVAHTADNGIEALKVVERNQEALDILILDHHMPQMTGLEVVAQLRERVELSCIPIILFTGTNKEEVESQANALGVRRVVYKPILPFELIATAQEVVEKAK